MQPFAIIAKHGAGKHAARIQSEGKIVIRVQSAGKHAARVQSA